MIVKFFNNKKNFIIVSLFLVFFIGFFVAKLVFKEKEVILFEFDGGNVSTNDLGLYMHEMNISDKYINNLFLNSILEIESNNLGVTLSADKKEEIKKGVFSSYGGEQSFNEYLSFQKINIDSFFEQKYKDYILELVMSKTFPYSKDDVKKFFNENKELFVEEKKYDFSEIVVSEINIANDAINSLNSGANFNDVAKKYSERSSSQGYVYKSNLSEKYISVLDEMKIDEVSNVFEDDYGYTILKLNNVYSEKDFDFIKDYPSIEKVFLSNLVSNHYNEWFDLMKEKYKLKIK